MGSERGTQFNRVTMFASRRTRAIWKEPWNKKGGRSKICTGGNEQTQFKKPDRCQGQVIAKNIGITQTSHQSSLAQTKLNWNMKLFSDPSCWGSSNDWQEWIEPVQDLAFLHREAALYNSKVGHVEQMHVDLSARQLCPTAITTEDIVRTQYGGSGQIKKTGLPAQI